MLHRRVVGDEEWKVKVAVFVKEGGLMMYNMWVCEEERAEERR